LARDGPNTIEVAQAHRDLRLFLAQFRRPIVLILVAATALSMALGDVTDGSIILVIIAASGALGFWQEHTAGQAVDALLAQVRIEAEVLRGGRKISVPVVDIVVGDVLVLAAGDVVPADCRVIESHRLLVDEAVLTGESYPAEKSPGVVMTATPLAGRSNSLFMGTHVVSGAGEAVVAKTGRSTEFGAVSARCGVRGVTTGFERGITAFGLLLVRAMVVLVTAIFVINLMLDRPFVDSLLFSLALAVGLTPQLLPAIVSISLSTGARRMAAEKVIVKRLDAIEDFGAMTVLCTDKTGTITAGAVRIDGAFDLTGRSSEEVLRLAALNAGLQRGFPNPLDQAILAGASPIDPGARLDEIPYDFERKRLGVLVEDHGAALLVTKGAFSKVLEVCAAADIDGRTVPLEEARADLEHRFAALSADGYRVLALATRSLTEAHVAGEADETDMTLRGLLAFHDPPKPGAAEAIRQLESRGVPVRLVTGANRLAAGKVAADVGLDARPSAHRRRHRPPRRHRARRASGRHDRVRRGRPAPQGADRRRPAGQQARRWVPR
jgi:P-type Mg2+ transporter